MLDKIYFSIVVPIFNCELYLEKLVNSVLKQDYQCFELILIDDGSTDNSSKIIEKFNDERIKFIQKKHSGVSDCRNLGINVSKYDYICFIDSDDYICSNFLSSFVEVIEKYNPDLISCGFYSEVNNKYDSVSVCEKFYRSKDEIIKDVVFLYDKHILYNIWNKVFKKEIIKKYKISFPNHAWGEDIYFNQVYLRHINNYYNINKCLYHYVRERKGSITTKFRSNLFDLRIKENKNFIDFFNSLKIKKVDYNYFISKRFIERIPGCIENVFYGNYIFKEKYNEIKRIILHKETRIYLKFYKPNSLKMKILIIPIKLKSTIICYFFGFVINSIRTKFPSLFNKLKNKR